MSKTSKTKISDEKLARWHYDYIDFWNKAELAWRKYLRTDNISSLRKYSRYQKKSDKRQKQIADYAPTSKREQKIQQAHKLYCITIERIRQGFKVEQSEQLNKRLHDYIMRGNNEQPL